jgi:O-antigen/teichoic acid export membrane protein
MFRYFVLLIIPVAFGFIAIGKDLLIFLASSKYIEAYPVLAYVVIGQSIYACTIILNSGLFINKKTYIVNNIMILTCLFNIGINLFLIPRFGIIGAAQATLISYIVYAIVISYFAFREFSFRIDFQRIIRYAIAAAIMFIAVKNVHIQFALLSLLCQIGVGVVTYSLCVLILDKEIRQRLLSFS